MAKKEKKKILKTKIEMMHADYPLSWELYLEFASREIDIFEEPERFSEYIHSVDPNRQGVVLTAMTVYMLNRRFPFLKAEGWVMWWQMGLVDYTNMILAFWKDVQAPARASELLKEVLETHKAGFKGKSMIEGQEIDDLHDSMILLNEPFQNLTVELMTAVETFIKNDQALQGPPLFDPNFKTDSREVL